MSRSAGGRLAGAEIAVVASLVIGPKAASADEGGISFWTPGTYGALAAAPLPQGFSQAEVYYHAPVNGGGDVAIARQVPIAGVTTTVPTTLDIHVGVGTNLLFSIPRYAFATPVLGGQAAVGLLIPYGGTKASVDPTLVGPRG